MKRVLIGFFIIISSYSSMRAQENGPKSHIDLYASYSWSDDLKALGIGLDFYTMPWDYIPWMVTIGAYGGPAWGMYNGELRNSDIVSAIQQDMPGTTLNNYNLPDDSDGGYMIGGRLGLGRFFPGTIFTLLFGVRADYYSPQEISVYNVSEDNSGIYYQYTQIPYKESIIIPGIELGFKYYQFSLVYSYSFLPEGEVMHTIGGVLPLGHILSALY